MGIIFIVDIALELLQFVVCLKVHKNDNIYIIYAIVCHYYFSIALCNRRTQDKMPKYYCDYCDTYLTHDSPSVRKTHNGGRKHKYVLNIDSIEIFPKMFLFITMFGCHASLIVRIKLDIPTDQFSIFTLKLLLTILISSNFCFQAFEA